MSRLERRAELAVRFFNLTLEYLTPEQRKTYQLINEMYEERKLINDPNWSGIHFESYRQAVNLVPGGSEVMQVYADIQ